MKKPSWFTLKQPLDSSFWDEWDDDNRFIAIAALMSIFIMLVLEFASTIPDELQRAQIYTNMLVVAVMIGAIDLIGDKIYPKLSQKIYMQFISLGRSPQQALIALLVGGALGLMAFKSILAAIGAPHYSAEIAGGTPAFLQFAYSVVVAPFVEESFFRGALMPTLANLIGQIGIGKWGSGVLACSIQSVAFGYMHWIAYGASSEGIFAAILFGFIVGVGTYMFQSLSFALGLHAVNNYIVFTG